MGSRETTSLWLLAGATVCAVLLGASAPGPARRAAAPDALASLLASKPGVRVHRDGGRVAALYGAPMASGATAQAAEEAFLSSHLPAFGVPALTLEPAWSADVSGGRFTVFALRQTIDGIPVEHGLARVLVRNGTRREGTHDVVYAAGSFSPRPASMKPRIDGAGAVRSVRAMKTYADLPAWSEPTLAIFQGEGEWTTPVLAWTFTGENPDLDHRERIEFFVDAATGRILLARDGVLRASASGTVQGKATPGTGPDQFGNTPQLRWVPDARVALSNGPTTYTEDNGSFNIFNAGSGTVTISTGVVNARWVSINNAAGSEITASAQTTLPNPVALVLNNSPTELNTSQVNALIHVQATHDYFRDRAALTAIDSSLLTNVNINDPCDAFYDGTSLSFARASGNCRNTAYSTIISHEYGHFVVARLGLGQGGFGEGFGDATAMLLHDTGTIGSGITGTGSFVRSPAGANQQYPCGSTSIHTCGQILAGVWWDIRQNFGSKYGSATGLEFARQLHVDWAMVTGGGQGSNFVNSAHPLTAIEVLTVNDDDGNLANGTPDYEEICAAFMGHGIDCPKLSLVTFQYAGGLPRNLSPAQGHTFQLTVLPKDGNPDPGTAYFSFSIDGAPFTTVPMTVTGTNQYQISLPSSPCLSDVAYYFTVDAQNGITVTDPPDAPESFYFSVYAGTASTFFTDNVETDKGWTLGLVSDDANGGDWERGNPNGTPAQPEDDHSDPGTICFFTGQAALGLEEGRADVDEGKTTLLTPVFNLSGSHDALISYWRWYSNSVGANPNTDTFRVDVTNDLSNWVNVETVGPSGPETVGGWIFREFRLKDFVNPSSTVRLRFIAEDLAPGSIVEAAIDDFAVVSLVCDEVCVVDLTGNDVVDSDDFILFLQYFASANPAAELTGNGVVDSDDFIRFLQLFAAGCP